jgi:putative ABC transport system permease protein
VGVPASLGVSRLLSGFVYGVAPDDPITLATGLLVLSAVALLACVVPARRAARVAPLIALRAE